MGKYMKTMDGNTAAAHVAYMFTDVAAIYPITPSSPMAEYVDVWSATGRKNLFGQTVHVAELQSEGGASGAMHGSLAAGALTTTFTASQGLLLMLPNMYKIAGELLPGVFHVTARAVAGHALSIFGDHSDVMAARQTGFAMLAGGSVQEAADLAGVAHLAAIKGRVPFVHFFDGFRTSHEIQKIELLDDEEYRDLVDWDQVKAFRDNALNPEHPVTRGTAQNSDIYFQAKESANRFYDDTADIVADYMKKIGEKTGRTYKPFNYYGDPEAENIIIAMGSVTETIEETVDYLNKQGQKVGLIKVHLFRPFAPEYLLSEIPANVKKIAVLDRTKEPGALGEPLYQEIRSLFYRRENAPEIVGGRYGLGSKDTTPNQIEAVYANLEGEMKDGFTLGIVDDVTNLSLPIGKTLVTSPEGTISCKFWGLGSDGTVGANKSAIKIIGDNTDMYAQGYFAYDSKKSGGVTMSHLRFGKNPIKSTYLINNAEFISCSQQSYVNQYDLLAGIKDGGTFLLNSGWDTKELEEKLPASMKRDMAAKNVKFYTIDATGIAGAIGLGNRTNMIMQSAFFTLSKVIPMDEAIGYLKDSIEKAYSKKGEKIVKMNWDAVDKGVDALVEIEVPASWADATDEEKAGKEVPEYIEKVVIPVNRQAGDALPVSTFAGAEDGHFPQGTAAYEKRGIAVKVPEWISDKCIQCNQCSFVCPHAVIRPFLLNDEEKVGAPDDMTVLDAKGKGLEGLGYKIQISPLDCTGCGNCADICPANALEMTPLEKVVDEESVNWDYLIEKVTVKDDLVNKFSVKGSQFAQPYLEFSGACAGCGETPYAKVITQLYGERMVIANATGCSSIWGGSAPSTPYCTNDKGQGPAWANSLFEDNAEYGYGMLLGINQIRDRIVRMLEELLTLDAPQDAKEAAEYWLANKDDAGLSKRGKEMILAAFDTTAVSGRVQQIFARVLERDDTLVKKSLWIFGGDGWAYDIGYGGLDHVLASGDDVNVLVFDTEVYSNTGGQSSKATPTAAVAKFAASGKKVKKKDLGLMQTTYGYVYVAQVSMGANKNQFLKAVAEAEAYPGPSLIIAYSPCITHGIKEGMGRSQNRAKEAVEAGYWHLYRYNPTLKAEGKNPFTLDSKEPSKSFQEFLAGEVRYTSLTKSFPDVAEELFAKAEESAQERYESYKNMADK